MTSSRSLERPLKGGEVDIKNATYHFRTIEPVPRDPWAYAAQGQDGQSWHEFTAAELMESGEIEVASNGDYTIRKKTPGSQPVTFSTLDLYTGLPGIERQDGDLKCLRFYSLIHGELPSYHSWNGGSSTDSILRLAEQFSRSPTTMQAELITQLIEEQKAQADEDAAKDPTNKLRRNPGIKPTDADWLSVYHHFSQTLDKCNWKEESHVPLLRIMEDEFLESQKLLLIPAADNSRRAKIQEEDSVKYAEAVKTSFTGYEDNTILKFAMLRFGLPIEPLTYENVMHAGTPDDKPNPERKRADDNGMSVHRITYTEKPLDFLSYYDERSHGYPMIRIRKRELEDFETALSRAGRASKKRLRAAKHSNASPHMSCGNNPVGAFSVVDQGYTPSLRGGGGPDPHLANDKTLVVCSNVGRFIIERSWTAFHDITKRLFRVDGVFSYSVHAIPIKFLDRGHGMNPPEEHEFTWSNTDDGRFEADSFEILFLTSPADLWSWEIHICLDKEVYQAWKENLWFARVVELELEDIGTAYWYIPINYNDILGTNQLQETFRNAVEYLLEQHHEYIVDWEFQEGTPQSGEGTPQSGEGLAVKEPAKGRLILAAEAPSKELWNAALIWLSRRDELIKESRDDTLCQELIGLRLTIVPQDQGQVRVIIPGERRIASHRVPIDASICRTIRNAVHKRAVGESDITVWNGSKQYRAQPQTPKVYLDLGANGNEDEKFFKLSGLELGKGVILARPNFDQFTIFGISPEGSTNRLNSATWESKVKTVGSFRRAIKVLWPDFSEDQEEVCINQAKSNDTFVIGPGMQEYQWRLQVYNWLDSPRLYVFRRPRRDLRYSIEIINGPLWPIHSAKEESGAAARPRHFRNIISEPGVARNALKPITKNNDAPIMSQTGDGEELPSSAPPRRIEGRDYRYPDNSHGADSPAGGFEAACNNTNTDTQDNAFEPRPENTDVTDEARESRAAFHKWQDEKDRETNRRIAAFTRDESVYEYDQPSIPKYGRPLEGTVSASGLDVKVFTQVRTAAEVEKLEREKRHYQNLVLERQQICQICQCSLMGFNVEAKAIHLDKHVKTCQASLTCPFCENEDWGDMQAADKVKHALSHVTQVACPWCNFSLGEQTDEERREHYSSHVRENHIGGRPVVAEVKTFICPWCNIDLTTLDRSAQRIHCGSHLYKCFWPTCGSVLAEKSDRFQRDHYMAHIEQLYELRESDRQLLCALCYQTFEKHDEELIIDHFRSHCSYQCPWPGCKHVFANADGEDTKRAHILMHTDTKAGQVSSPGAEETEENHLDYIPERMRKIFPGKLFYCPEKTCAQDVSGRLQRPCKYHRDAGHVGKTGHNQWLVLTPQEGSIYMRNGARLAPGLENKTKLSAQNESYPVGWRDWKPSSWSKSVQEKPVSAGEGSLGSGPRSEEGEADRPARLLGTLKEPLQRTATSEGEESLGSCVLLEVEDEPPERMFNTREESFYGTAMLGEEGDLNSSSDEEDEEPSISGGSDFWKIP